jgi:hypothetical protein
MKTAKEVRILFYGKDDTRAYDEDEIAIMEQYAAQKNVSEKVDNKYEFKTYNGRVKIYFNGSVIFTFNQIDFLAYYFFKDDVNLYGCTLYFLREGAGGHEMDVYFKDKETWLSVNRLLDENM